MIPDPYNPRPDAADALGEGYFLLRRARARRVDIPVRIWYGPPADPVTGEDLDRSARWQIEINGVAFGDEEYPAAIDGRPIEHLSDFWPVCRGERIDAAEYAYRVARAEHAELHDFNDPFGGGRIDPMTATLPFL